MDKLDRFEKILNLVERARRLDFLAIDAMERMNKTNIDFYNFYTKIDTERNKQYTNSNQSKENCVNDLECGISQKEENTEIKKEIPMEPKPEYSEEALKAFMNSFSQPKTKETTQPQTQPYIPQQPYVQPSQPFAPQPQYVPQQQYVPQPQYVPQQHPYAPYGQPYNPYGQPYPQQQYVPPVQPQAQVQTPTPTQAPAPAPQQPYAYNVNINAAPLPPDSPKEEEEPTPAPSKDQLEKMRSLSSVVAEKIRVQTDVLKQTHEAFTETHRQSFLLWKEIDDYLSKNKTNGKQ
jgi:hypothetical protein